MSGAEKYKFPKSMSFVDKFDTIIEYEDFMYCVIFNEMNQWHNCIQGGKYGWKEGAN